MYLNTLDFGQGEEIDSLREMVRRFAQEKIAPLAAGIDQAPESRLLQNGPPGCTSRTSIVSARFR